MLRKKAWKKLGRVDLYVGRVGWAELTGYHAELSRLFTTRTSYDLGIVIIFK